MAEPNATAPNVPVALIGGAHIHTPKFAETLAHAERIETRYVWDPDPDTAQRRQQVTGGDVIDDPQQAMDDPDLEGVIICAQTDLHERLVTAAANAGKHMFVEKPLGMNSDDAWRMARQIERAGVMFQTGYFMRGSAQVQTIARLIREGTFGKITRIRMSNAHGGALHGWFDDEWRWMADPSRAGCGGFGDLGTHVLDLLLWLMQEDEVTHCTAQLGRAIERYDSCDEYGEGLLRFRSGALATIAAGWVDRANPNYLEISGTEAHARLEKPSNALYLNAPAQNIDGAQPYENLDDAWPHAFDTFLGALRAEEAAIGRLVTASEAALRNSVMDAMYQAAHDMTWRTPDAPAPSGASV